MSNTTHTDKTSADSIAVAFDYQYYYFLFKVFSLEDGQSVGLEVKDDVHTELSNNIQLLIQLKHSVQTNASGDSVNLTTLDSDLWHTLYNWCEVIIDKEDGRDNAAKQIEFVKKTYFILVSNKSYTKENKFIEILNNYKLGFLTHEKAKNEITEIDTKNEDIKKYKAKLLSLNDEVSKLFLKNIEFDLNNDDLIKKCKIALKSNMIPEKNIDDLFKKLDSSIREENYTAIKKNQKVIINFKEYYKKYRIYYDQARNTDLQIKTFQAKLPDNLTEQRFIKHLIDINDISDDDIDDIIEFTKYKLQIQNNVSNWLQEAELTKDQLDDFEKEVIAIWKNEFRSKNRGLVTEEEIQEKALSIVDTLRKERLSISSLQLDTQHSNGEFYHLSDNLKIGWRKDWAEKYNG